MKQLTKGQKISLSKIGRKFPKISEALKGRKLSQETKDKISLFNKENPNRYWLGKRFTKEHIQKAIETKSKNPTRYWLGKKRPSMTGENNHNYKGGTHSNNGYIRLGTQDKRYQHRKVMEDYLGRELTREEHVHHIDGDKTNNNIDNLMLFPTNSAHQRYHAEQRRNGSYLNHL